MALVLRIAGDRFEGWESVTVSRGMDRLCSSFNLTVSDKPWRVRPGMPCEVTIDRETVITGYVDRVTHNFSGGAHSLDVSGRSKCGDLVDCSAQFGGGQFDGLRLLQIAAALAQPFGIAARTTAEGSAGARQTFDTVKLNPGESVQTVLERLARYKGVLVTDDAQGNLVITARSDARASATLVEGQNAVSLTGRFSAEARFSRYTVLGQRPSSSFSDELQSAQVKAEAIDQGVEQARYRPLVMVASQPLDAAQASRLVRHEATVRYGRSADIAAQVEGWRERPRDAASPLWSPNKLIRVISPSLDIDRDLLIAGVNFSISSAGGLATGLSLVRPEAYDPEPPVRIKPINDDYAAIRQAVEEGRGQ